MDDNQTLAENLMSSAMTSVFEAVTLLDTSAVILLVITLVVFFVPIFILFPPIPVERSDALRQTHAKLGVPLPESNLRTQISEIHYPQPGQPARIQSLYIYPVKSCRGIELKRSKVLPKGLEFDRLYTFARLRPRPTGAAANDPEQEKRPKWEIATLRQLSLLANVQVDLWLPDETKFSRLLGKTEDGFLVVRFPWKDAGIRGFLQLIAAKLSRGLGGVPEKEFMLPIEFPSQEEIKARGYHYEDIQFFGKAVYALNMGPEVPPELATYLEAKGPISLFRMDPAKRREVFKNAPRKEIVGFQPVVDFQDGYPLHLLNLTSVRALESNIQKDETIDFLDARRFRPNIIVSGLREYDEDDWRSIQAKPTSNRRGQEVINFDVSCRTVRCKLPNVDPATGIRHRVEPDNALRKYRDIDEGAPRKGCFGMQLCPLFAGAEGPDRLQAHLEVGMEINVLQRGPHFAL
ncbi:Mitochondrial amidoxime-reducing component 1-like protein [Cladobotryum mycophilum]|uniref:Mitochondrial amidoxime-reducing component 1-like protein n=1 Tax=Cladobotryum mycophilum TaxID=491253 RepID=A0ABR0T3C9_9HYPO